MSKTSKTWWGQRFIDVLERQSDPGRLARGRHYLNTQQIRQWEVRGGRVEARIRGKVNPYYGIHEVPIYSTWLAFEPIPAAAWDEALDLIGSRAGYISRLLVNEMPDEMERPLSALGVRLLPQGPGEIQSGCDCPDLEAPCKHTAALFYLLASRLDQDPFMLFELRGLSRAQLIGRLKATPLGTALASALDEAPEPPVPKASFFTRPLLLDQPTTVSPRDFWRGQRKLPAGVEPPPPVGVSGILIRKGGNYPSFWDKEESFVDVMDAFYEQVRKKGKDSF